MRCLDTPGESPTRLHHLPPRVMHRRPIVVTRPDQRKLVGNRRMARQQLRNLEGVGFGTDRFKRTTNFGGRIRLHVPQVDVTGAAEVEDHDARTPVVRGLHYPSLFGLQVLRQRQPHRRQRTHLKELPPRNARATKTHPVLGRFCEEVEHDGSLSEICSAPQGADAPGVRFSSVDRRPGPAGSPLLPLV